MQPYRSNAGTVFDYDVGDHGLVEDASARTLHGIGKVSRETVEDAEKRIARDIEARHKRTCFIAHEQVVAFLGVAQQQIALLHSKRFMGRLCDLLVRQLVQNEVLGLIPRRVSLNEVHPVAPVVAASTAEMEGSLLNDRNVLSLLVSLQCRMRPRKAAADDKNIGIVELVKYLLAVCRRARAPPFGCFRCRTSAHRTRKHHRAKRHRAASEKRPTRHALRACRFVAEITFHANPSSLRPLRPMGSSPSATPLSQSKKNGFKRRNKATVRSGKHKAKLSDQVGQLRFMAWRCLAARPTEPTAP